MIRIKAKLGGREVTMSQFGSGIERIMYAAAAESVREKLEDIKCPEHGASLEAIVLKKAGEDKLAFELEGCCQKLADACEKRMASL